MVEIWYGVGGVNDIKLVLFCWWKIVWCVIIFLVGVYIKGFFVVE